MTYSNNNNFPNHITIMLLEANYTCQFIHNNIEDRIEREFNKSDNGKRPEINTI